LIIKKDNSKHLVVITPDVRIDRRTVQMCQSLIQAYGIKCTIIAALEEKDDFVTDKLKVKQANQYVSRAGMKLESVAQSMRLSFSDKIVLDVGSS
jgi:predicted rRNA methylase YqxC with S4 and FtsJ domains